MTCHGMPRHDMSRHGLANTLVQAAVDTPAAYKLIWLEPVEDEQLRNELWQRIYEGDVPDSLVQP